MARVLDEEAAPRLSPAALAAAETAATVMAMNNVYYRFTQLASNPAYAMLPVKLRMSSIGNPDTDRADFELWSLAVSAMNGCGR
ncbi:alkylhydroperoxidase [Methylobacterium nodulans ORS 2060]|uniref:Alkyl hydroperoxide reductase AhpD n=1 Tax=Methylobacterium nodulans (strain LMG 21967 / CNCM I-2342 / ORS 2060) TaxID=460265 RepID=B8ITH2_METNO|nr:alkylhydroperoxidase [Methylobacterium nodulans ORS 2060]